MLRILYVATVFLCGFFAYAQRHHRIFSIVSALDIINTWCRYVGVRPTAADNRFNLRLQIWRQIGVLKGFDMKRFSACLMLIAFTSSWSSWSAADNDKAARLEALVSQWVGLERQADTLKAQWQQRELLMRQRIELLTLQKKNLQERLSDKTTAQTQVQEVRAQLLAKQGELEQHQAQLEQVLDGFQGTFTEIALRLPPPLQTQWQSLLSSLNTARGSTGRLDLYLEMLSAVEQFEKQVSQHQDVLELNGRQVLVKQIYLGIGRGWYVSADGQYAGVGKPDSEGWQWQSRPGLALQIKNVLAVLDQPERAELLPLDLSDVTKGR